MAHAHQTAMEGRLISFSAALAPVFELVFRLSFSCSE